MANLQELSSSSCISNGSSEQPITDSLGISLDKLSTNLGRLLIKTDQIDFADAEIEVDGSVIGVHRCILAARSSFFNNLFKGGNCSSSGKPRYSLKNLLPFGYIGFDAFQEFLVYLYTGKLRQPDPDISTCIDGDCMHDACRPAINFVVEMFYASHHFEAVDLVCQLQGRLLSFVGNAFVEDVIPILLAAFHTKINQLIEVCAARIAHSNFDAIALSKELPFELSKKITLLQKEPQSFTEESVDAPSNSIRKTAIKRLYRALDSDDIELVNLLLGESNITLDDANLLHYAAAYCDSKIVAEVLHLGMADVNLKNARGYTPLHLAAMRMDSALILALIRRGASVLEQTGDGRDIMKICRRITRPKDYNARESFKELSEIRLCFDILERELDPMVMPITREESMDSISSLEELQMKFEDLHNRVLLASVFFPAEAQLAMKIAETETRRLDLNETHTQQLKSNIRRLEKTVKLGRRYFPHCSEFLDNFCNDDEVLELCDYDGDLKRRRYNEIKAEIEGEFTKDIARKYNISNKALLKRFLPSSSSYSSTGNRKQSRCTKK